MNLDLKKAYEKSMVLARQHTDFSVDMLKAMSALVMKNTGGEYHTINGDFDASKGEFRLLGVTAGTGRCVKKRTFFFLCTKPRLSQAEALLLPKDFVSLNSAVSSKNR